MRRFFQSLLALLAVATDRQLVRYIEYLKTENRILRSKLPARITVTPQERQRLLKYGKPLGRALHGLITIVTPRTFARWVQGETSIKRGARPTKPGRPRTAAEIRALVLKLARENGWGYTRIIGELRKLGIAKISRTTVLHILREEGLDPGPKRGEDSWDEFLKRHAATLWACDFFSTKVWTPKGRVEMFVLFFIHVGTRRVHLAGMTAHPDARWMMQQARNVALVWAEQPVQPRILLRDHDTKFTQAFDGLLQAEGITVKPVGPFAPNLNAVAERWVQSVKQECLTHFVIFGERHLRYLLTEYRHWYHQCRPHQGLGNKPLQAAAMPATRFSCATEDVGCDERLGGLLKHYYWKVS